MCLVNSKPKNFIWAHSSEANIKEPPEALKENGWRYGDIPTAANFNWIFNNMMNEIRSVWREVKELEEEEALINEHMHLMTGRINKIANGSNNNIKNISELLLAVANECEKLVPGFHVFTGLVDPTPIPVASEDPDEQGEDDGE